MKLTNAQQTILSKFDDADEVFTVSGRQRRSCEKLREAGLIVSCGSQGIRRGSALNFVPAYAMSLKLRQQRGASVNLTKRLAEAFQGLARSPWNYPVASVKTFALTPDELEELKGRLVVPGVLLKDADNDGCSIEIRLERVGEGTFDEETEDAKAFRSKFYCAARQFFDGEFDA